MNPRQTPMDEYMPPAMPIGAIGMFAIGAIGIVTPLEPLTILELGVRWRL